MCGIIAAFNTQVKVGKGKKALKIPLNEVNDFIINQYENQQGRGTRGYGIIRIDRKGKIEIDRACEGTKFLLDLYMPDKKSEMIIAHHRTPTSTDNKLDQTHPMLIENDILKYSYLVVHNGIVSNDKELHEKHLALGFQYYTEYTDKSYYSSNSRSTKWNDSEAIAIELALFIERKTAKVEIDNPAAFVILQINKETGIAEKVLFGRNGYSSSLNMSKTRGKLRISSEGEGNEIKENRLYSFKIGDPTMDLTHVKIPFAKKVIETRTIPSTSTPSTKVEESKAHSPLCECLQCKNTRTIERTLGQSSPVLNLPYKQDLNNNTEKKEESTVRSKRPWNNSGINDDSDYSDMPPYADKGYATTTGKEFKEKLKNKTTNEITHIVDDALDEEIEKISEIAVAYKNVLMTDHLEKEEETFFNDQISKIIEAMKVIANIAEMDYQEKGLIEMQEEEERSGFHYSPGSEELLQDDDPSENMNPHPMGFRGKIHKRNPDNIDEFEEGRHRHHPLS